jgi:hypothetical protein
MQTLNLRYPAIGPQIVAAANMFGDLLKKYKYRTNSIASTAELLPEFIEKTQDKVRFEGKWIAQRWFAIKFEKWLGRKGIINLED